MPYTLNRNGRYQRGRYRHFLRRNFVELHAFLVDFDGLILGQNLFDYDYRVLRPYFSLQGIVEKTFDLLFFLDWIDPLKLAGLSLATLASHNLSRGKLLKGRNIAELSRAGRVKEVAAYNERDCELVAQLWMKLVEQRFLYSEYRAGRETFARFEVTDEHIPVLLGERPFFTYEEWTRRLAEWGRALRNPRTGGKRIIEEPALPGELVLFHKLRCPRCGRHFVLRAGRSRIYKPRAAKACPFCKRRVPLASGGTLLNDNLGPRYFVHMRRGVGRLTEKYVPSEEAAREYIRGLRFWRY